MSIVHTLKKLVDPIQARKDDAVEEEHELRAAQQDQDSQPPKEYKCRVCGLVSGESGYCPECLALTMVEES